RGRDSHRHSRAAPTISRSMRSPPRTPAASFEAADRSRRKRRDGRDRYTDVHPPVGDVVMVAAVPTIHAPSSGPRPLRSVMIPVYEPGESFAATLRSILDQDTGVDRMQIELVDAGGERRDWETTARRLAGDRIAIH